MGLYGSPDLSNQYGTNDNKSNKPSKKKMGFPFILLILDILILLLVGFSIDNVLTVLLLDCIIIFLYSTIKLIYNIIKKRNFKNHILAMITSFIMFFIFVAILGSLQPNDSGKITNATIKETTNKESYMAAAKTYEYKELARNPEEYKGEIAAFKGKVIQVSEGSLNTIYRVATKDGIEDIIYVTYKRPKGEDRVLENDIVTIYGDLNGVTTYKSVLGGNITIPSVKARYIVVE
jgi:hypothetical protein